MPENNYTLKLTLAEATLISILLKQRKQELERKIMADPNHIDVADQEEYALVERLAARL